MVGWYALKLPELNIPNVFFFSSQQRFIFFYLTNIYYIKHSALFPPADADLILTLSITGDVVFLVVCMPNNLFITTRVHLGKIEDFFIWREVRLQRQ